MRAVGRVLLVVFATLLVMAVLALWQLPRFLDWNRYRDDISRIMATVLDRPVLIDGPITLRLLPQPTLIAADVRIAGEPDEGTLSARELSLVVGLAPLLAGRIQARELVLSGADIQLPWPLPDKVLPLRRPGWLAGLSARIEDGRLAIGKAQATVVAATLSVGGPVGGYQFDATIRVDNRTWLVTAHLGSAGADNAAPVDVTIDGEGALRGTEATFSGQVSPDGAGGRLIAKGPDLGLLLPAPKLPFSADGRLTVAAGLVAADDLAVVIGGASAHGAVSLRMLPSLRLDLAIAASRLDLDAWLPVLLHGQAWLCPVGLDLSAEAAPFAGGLLRKLRAASELDGGQVTIRDASATLPGEAGVRLAGRIMHPAPGRPRFEGSVAVTAPDLRATLQWLAPLGLGSPDTLPPSVLRSLTLSGQVVAEPNGLAITGLAGTLDGSRLSGSVALTIPVSRESETVRADLKLDRLDLDAWLPSGLPPPGDLARLPGALDADMRLRAEQARWRGITIGDLVVDGAATGGRLSIRQLAGKALGVQANLSGAVDASGHVAGARLALATGDATPLADWLQPPWRAAPVFWRAPLRIDAQAEGPPDALDLSVHVTLADSDLTVAAKLNLSAHAGTASVDVKNPEAPQLLTAAGLGSLAAWLGSGPLQASAQLDVAPDRLGADGIDVAAGLLHARGKIAVDRSGELPRVTGQLTADTLPPPRIDLHAPDPLPLDLLRGWQATIQIAAGKLASEPPGAPRVALQDASATVTLAQGRLQLEDLRATLAGGTLSGSASLDAASQPPALALQAALRDTTIAAPVTGLPLDIVAGHADGDLTLTAAGHSPAAMLATLGGRLRVSIGDGALVGFDLGALAKTLATAPREGGLDAALKAALASGRTSFGRLEMTATAAGGVLTIGEATLRTADGDATFSGSIDFPGSAVDLHAAIRPAIPDAPAIGLRITGPADAPKHLPELADVTRWQMQHPHTP